jgi:NDP-sugar pyrophosphorylase family protein
VKLNSIDAVILCGGLGTRLRSVIGESPKPMAEFDHEPFLNVLIRDLRAQGFGRVILCAGYKAKVIEDYYRQHDLGMEVVVSKEPRPLGTAGAILHARRSIKSETFVVLNGDSYCRVDYAKLLAFHLQKKAIASMVIVEVKNKKDFGIIVLDKTKKIVGFSEKTALKARIGKGLTTGINAGIYGFNQGIFALFPKKHKISFEYDLFPKWVSERFYGFEIKEKFIDIGTPQRYKQAQVLLKKDK